MDAIISGCLPSQPGACCALGVPAHIWASENQWVHISHLSLWPLQAFPVALNWVLDVLDTVRGGRLNLRFNLLFNKLRLRKRREESDKGWLSRCSWKQSPCISGSGQGPLVWGDIAQGCGPSFLESAYLFEDMRLPWEGAPHHTEGTCENTKIGPLFLSVINKTEQVTARGEASLQLVLLKEDLRVHGAAGDSLGCTTRFDQLQLGIGQVFLSDLWLYRKTKAKHNASWPQSSCLPYTHLPSFTVFIGR